VATFWGKRSRQFVIAAHPPEIYVNKFTVAADVDRFVSPCRLLAGEEVHRVRFWSFLIVCALFVLSEALKIVCRNAYSDSTEKWYLLAVGPFS
jgi:hypothetical protein